MFSISVANFTEAYLSLARAVDQSRTENLHNCLVARSPVRSALGNFAICYELDRTAAFEIWRASQDADIFQVYVPIPDSVDQQLLLERGFEYQQTLELMTMSEALPVPKDPLTILEIDQHGRQSVAQFMTGIFFRHQNGVDRERTETVISQADLKLYCAWRPLDLKTYRTMVGAMSIQFQPDSVGVYNLCVDPTRQRRGIGSSMISTFANCRFIRQRPLVLQCNPSLIQFYERLGFSSTGHVQIFSKKA